MIKFAKNSYHNQQGFEILCVSDNFLDNCLQLWIELFENSIRTQVIDNCSQKLI